MVLLFEKPVHNGIHGFIIAIGIFTTQKAGKSHGQHRNAIGLLCLPGFLIHIVANDAGHAGRGNHQAFGMAGLHRIGNAFMKPFDASENTVFFSKIGGNQRHRVPFFRTPVSSNAVMISQIHGGCHMGASGRAVKYDYAALIIGHRPPHAGHGAAGRAV